MAGTASYERRNARARALGYDSYYDFRVKGSGRLPPSTPRPRGQELARARGHTSRADLLRAVRPGTLITATPDISSRRKDGTYTRFYVTTISPEGREREFLLQGRSAEDVAALALEIERRGGIFSPSPSLDLRSLATMTVEPEQGDWRLEHDYRKAEGRRERCSTCSFYERGGRCRMFNADVQASFVCDEWARRPRYTLVKVEE